MHLSRIFVATIALLASAYVYAAPPAEYSGPSPAALKQLRINHCDQSAEKAKSIMQATIKAKKFNAAPEVLRQTAPDSPERAVMQQLFHSKWLISSVLIQSAAFGAGMTPSGVGEQSKRDIEELTYDYVRSMCIAASLEQ